MTAWFSGRLPEGIDPMGGAKSYWVDGTGNRFVLVDALDAVDFARWEAVGPAWAQSFVEGKAPWRDTEGHHPDGLVLLLPPRAAGQVRMAIFNVDGSRPEACGNALRCLTRVAFDTQRVGTPQFVVETDAGDRSVDALEWGSATTRVSMGPPRLIDGRLEVEALGQTLGGVSISMGNPHLVIDSNTVLDADVPAIGAALCTHPHFPQGTNVEFVFGEVEHPRVRVWERGVGETEACGSGACAVAHALFGTALIRRPLTLQLPGGELVVGRDTFGLWLEGAARWEILELEAPQTTRNPSDH